MKRFVWIVGLGAAMMACPLWGMAQAGGVTPGMGGLQGVLDQIYNDMLPQSSQLIGVGQAIAGFAALWFIAVRVWRSIAAAEPVDVFPLLRPFVLGIAIMVFPSVIALMNGVLSPTVTGTAQMLGNANAAIATLVQQKEAAIETNMLNAGPLASPSEFLMNDLTFGLSQAYYSVKNMIQEGLAELLQVLYEAAALCISTIRIFNLIVLAILGPLVLGLGVFDGFQYTVRAWVARYINVFLWLPVANIFGAIIANVQVQMLKLDIQQIQANGGTYFSSTDLAYLVFLIIGIVGYMTVPTVAGYIVNVGGGGGFVSKATSVFAGGTSRAIRGAGNLMGAPGQFTSGWKSAGGKEGDAGSKAGNAGRAGKRIAGK